MLRFHHVQYSQNACAMVFGQDKFSVRDKSTRPALCLRPGSSSNGQRGSTPQVVRRRPKAHSQVSAKYVLHSQTSLTYCSAFASLSTHQMPPPRRISQDEAPSMLPVPAATSQVPMQATQVQVQAHLSQQLSQHSHPPSGRAGSVASFASLSAGSGVHTRKKARLG